MCIRDSGKLSANENVNNETTDDRVSNGVNYNGDIIENGVSEIDTFNKSSDDVSIKLVEISNGVVMSVGELEREWEESLNEFGVQRANFSGVKGYLGVNGSANIPLGYSPLGYFSASGKARWCINVTVLPSAWSESCLLYTSRCV